MGLGCAVPLPTGQAARVTRRAGRTDRSMDCLTYRQADKPAGKHTNKHTEKPATEQPHKPVLTGRRISTHGQAR